MMARVARRPQPARVLGDPQDDMMAQLGAEHWTRRQPGSARRPRLRLQALWRDSAACQALWRWDGRKEILFRCAPGASQETAQAAGSFAELTYYSV